MASISSSTKHTMKKNVPIPKATAGKKSVAASGKAGNRGAAPPLKAASFGNASAIDALKALDQEARGAKITDLFRNVLGQPGSVLDLSTPHAASTTRDRSGAAADLAVAARELGMAFVLKDSGILAQLEENLLPSGGLEGLVARLAAADTQAPTQKDAGAAPNVGGMKTVPSALSLSSMDNDIMDDTTAATSVHSGGTDIRRGKTSPPNAREGCLLLLRALCEICSRKAEPYVMGCGGAWLAAVLDECASSSGNVREAAADAAAAMVGLAHAWTFRTIIGPTLLRTLRVSTEWRVKVECLERLAQCASSTAPVQVHKTIPTLIPALANQVWDTKAQVSKAARSALLAVCKTNTNADIKPTIPALVNAVCKPADTNKAISELMGTTFVVPVDASTLAILCPVLARGLKEKLAIHKRAACVVISNMSKLVETPDAVAPFGYLLVPELHKVTKNVQFQEIRDEALKALASLTKALGDSYKEASEDNQADEMEAENARVKAEQERIQAERQALEKKEAEIRAKEEEEKKRFKEAMDAQRELDRIEAKEAEEIRKAEELAKEKAKLSTKGSTGQCQGCGLKKCKKTCMFYSG